MSRVIAMEVQRVELNLDLHQTVHRILQRLVHVNALMAGRGPIAILNQHVAAWPQMVKVVKIMERLDATQTRIAFVHAKVDS